MQGVQITYDVNGKPIRLMLDLNASNPAIKPLVDGLLELVRRSDEDTAHERTNWQRLSHASLNRVYGTDKPDYSDVPAYQL